jgi:hypothetical protein
MADFDVDRLATDALAISGPSGTGGEPFTYSSATYYGVFAELDRSLVMDTTSFKDERVMTMVFPRASLTAGIAVNAFIYRPFDSTTYQVTKSNPDLAWHEVTLRKPFDT